MVSKKVRIVKKAAPTHIVIPDTNILWHSDKNLVADPDFDIFWDTYRLTLPMELAIPEVVVGELNFQQATSAGKMLAKVSDSLRDLSGVLAVNHGTKLNYQIVKNQVENKINRWLKTKLATTISTPIDPLRWKNLIHAAIWRHPPFTYDPKNPDLEKGFRDALILETVIETANQALSSGKNIVFLCKDQLLLATAVEALKSKKNALCFDSLKDFEGYIKLTQEELTSSFVTAIQNRARQRFFTNSDQKSFYVSKNVSKLIAEKYSAQLKPSPNLNSLRTGLLSGGEIKWKLLVARAWIGSTTFEKLVQPRRYCWSTRVSLARLFREEPPAESGVQIDPTAEYVLSFEVDVKWSADVKADGRFLDADIDLIEMRQRSFEMATPELLKKWGLASS